MSVNTSYISIVLCVCGCDVNYLQVSQYGLFIVLI